MAGRFFEIIITGRQMAAAVAGIVAAIAVAFSLGFVVRILEPDPPATIQTVIVVATPTPAPVTPTALPQPEKVTPLPEPVGAHDRPAAGEQTGAGPRRAAPSQWTPPARGAAFEQAESGEGIGAEDRVALASPTPSASRHPLPPKASAVVPTLRPVARWVQVAAEATRGRAEGVRDRIVAAGFSSAQVSLLPGPGGLIRVRVGPFPDEESAGRIAARLHGKGFARAFVVRKGD